MNDITVSQDAIVIERTFDAPVDLIWQMWTTGKHTEVTPNERLAYTESMADENGNVIAPPADGQGHPGATQVTIQLEDLGGRTKMILTHAGVPADSPGAAGWQQAFAKLADYTQTVLHS